MYKNVELRKLPAASLCSIASILETNNDWKKVMSLIPRNPRNEYFEPKYNNEHIKQIEDHARTSNRKCAEILFEEWGTSGRIRPTLSTLKDVVQKAEIYRAADEIAAMLQEAPPERPHDGPAAPIDINLTDMLQESTEQKLNGTTVQMKSTSDMIKFSNSSNNASKISGSHTGDNKTTAQVQSASMNIPDLEALLDENSVPVSRSSNGEVTGPGYQTSLPDIDFSMGIATDILRDANLIHFMYRDLEYITKKFSETLIYIPDPVQGVQGKVAGKIGSGGFGEVFVGYHPQHGHLAVKKARNHLAYDRKPDIATRVFNSEVRFLSQFRHKNIVPIIGFSRDGPALCIVCDYIDGGSLEQKLRAKILTEKQRINIMIGTAEGLKYLHGSEKPVQRNDQELQFRAIETDSQNPKKNNFVHGDVKTANILLTRDFVPKLCDFGLAKQYDSTFITTCPMGTSAYMAPEGFGGTITQMSDIYSYGIVLLELLTGLTPLVVNNDRETVNIKDYIEETCTNHEITNVLDPFIDRWTKGKEIYNLARSCLERQRKSRPTAEEICEILLQISGIDKES